MDIEVRHLRMLCAIEEAGSLSQAASALGVTQPAITVSLRRLEGHVGGSLFTRNRTGVVPTELGQRLVARARVALAEVDHLAAGTLSASTDCQLVAGLSMMAPTCAIMAALEERLGSRIRFIADGSTASLAHDLKHRKHDFSVLLVSEDGLNELPNEVKSRVLQPSIPVFVAMQPSNPLASLAEIPVAALAQETWVAPSGSDDGSLADLRTMCAQAGFLPNVRYIAPPGTGRSIIEYNNAVQLAEPTTINTDRVVTRPIAGDPLRWRLVLAWHHGRLEQTLPDEIHRVVLDTYRDHAKQSPTYRSWWERNRSSQIWVRQLDQIFKDA